MQPSNMLVVNTRKLLLLKSYDGNNREKFKILKFIILNFLNAIKLFQNTKLII